MNILSKSRCFSNILFDAYMDRNEAASYEKSLKIFKRARENTNPYLYPRPTSILAKTVGLLLINLLIRVMHIFTHLLGSLFYLTQLQMDKTKYYLYLAVIEGPITLITKTITNCVRVFGCIVGFANPAAATSMWYIAENIDAFILRQKIAYTPHVPTMDSKQSEISGNAVFYFGPLKVRILARRENNEPLILKLKERKIPLRFVDLPPSSQPLKLETFSEYEEWKIRKQMAWFLKFLYQKYPQQLTAAITEIPSKSKLKMEMKCLSYYMRDLRDPTCAPYQRGYFKNYVLSVDTLVDIYLYLCKKFEQFTDVRTNKSAKEIWSIIAPTLGLS